MNQDLNISNHSHTSVIENKNDIFKDQLLQVMQEEKE